MKIKLAILEKDPNYLNRFVSAFDAKYADKFEIYSFTDSEIALATIHNARIDVVLASEEFGLDPAQLPPHCGFAYFTQSVGINSINDQRAICKYQKADQIYRQVLSIYSETAGRTAGVQMGDDHCKIIGFSSACGGVGTSCAAAACALYLASWGKKTLYLNLEDFGSADAFFSAEGQFDMSDIVFALKSKKANLTLKLESCVKQDPRGVYFYSQAKIALDMLELGKDEKLRLLSELKMSGLFDCIIVDVDFAVSPGQLDLYRCMDSIVMVGDGSEISNLKLLRAYNSIVTMEQGKESAIVDKLVLLYNKFSNKTGKTITGISVSNIGGAPRYEHASTEQVITELSRMSMFEKLI